MNTRQPTLLVVEDERLVRRSVMRIASQQGFRTIGVPNAEEGLDTLAKEDVDVVLVDQGLPGRLQGVSFIREARQRHPTLDYVLFTGEGDVSVGYEALQHGASDYFTKPIQDSQRFAQVLRRGVEARRLREENAHLQRRALGGEGHAERLLLGRSDAMEQLRSAIRRYAGGKEPILVTGDTGAGKDVVARALHAEGGRDQGRYVAVNCGAIPRELFESQLFGHEEGAFSGARSRHVGYFEEAGEGTVFLDEIGDLPHEMQVKLLRVLENRTFRRVGGSRDIEFRGRVVAATNRDLASMVEERTFRKDLWYRINMLRIRVPPLREHPEDIVILAYFFAKEKAATLGRTFKAIHPDAMRALMSFHWPGNVRQLGNVITSMLYESTGEIIGPAGLPPEVMAAGQAGLPILAAHPPSEAAPDASTPAPPSPAGGLHLPEELLDRHYQEAKEEVIRAFSTWYLGEALRRSGGNKTRAADFAGMRRPNLARLLKKFDVTVPDGVEVKVSSGGD
jgi:DNA-binding NtrC family response regulator